MLCFSEAPMLNIFGENEPTAKKWSVWFRSTFFIYKNRQRKLSAILSRQFVSYIRTTLFINKTHYRTYVTKSDWKNLGTKDRCAALICTTYVSGIRHVFYAQRRGKKKYRSTNNRTSCVGVENTHVKLAPHLTKTSLTSFIKTC